LTWDFRSTKKDEQLVFLNKRNRNEKEVDEEPRAYKEEVMGYCDWVRNIWSKKVIDEKLNYVHNNPVEEGIVFRAEDYLYSSATDYAGEKGLLNNVIVIE